MHLNAAQLKFSNINFIVILLLHLLAITFVLATGLNFTFKMLLAIMVIANLFWSAKQPKHFFQSFGKDIDGDWYLVGFDAEKDYVDLLPHSILTKYFVLLALKNRRGKKYYLPIFQDTIEMECFRKLRVILLFE